MKKIFSLLCAMMLVLSASAAPVFNVSRVSKKQAFEMKAQLPAIEMKKISHTRMVPVKTTATNIKKAPAIVNNDQIVADYSQAYFISSELTEAAALWEFDFYDGNDFAAYVFVEAIDGTHIVGTYSLEEGKVVVAAGDTTDITSGSMTITYDAPSATYQFVLSTTCANGQTYTMNHDFVVYEDFFALDYMLVMYFEEGWGFLLGIESYDDCIIELEDAPFVPTGDTINVVFPGVSLLTDATAAEGWFEFAGEGDEYYIYLDFFADQVVGIYGSDDFDYEYTVIYDANDTEIAAKNDAANTAEVYMSGDTTIIEAFFLAKDGNYYNVVMKYYIPTPTEIIDVVLDGEVDDETYATYGAIDYEIGNDDYVLSLLLYFSGAGTYTLDDVVGMNTKNSYFGDMNTQSYINIVDATFVIAADYSMTATLISTDARQFNITFTPQSTALKNVDAAAKVTKAIKNGQLVIEKNGVKFNAQGAKL